MDALSSLYGITGAPGPVELAIGVLIAVLLAGGFAALVLEAVRIMKEYSGPQVSYGAPASAAPAVRQPKVAAPAEAPKPVEKPAAKAPEKAPVQPIEVVKGTLKESIETLEKKYRLNAVTLATADGLVIASTINDPEEEAAVWSGRFNELNKDKPGDYQSLADKGIHMYSAESSGNKVIGIARRPSALEQPEIAGLQDDTRKIIDKFAPVVKKP